VQVCRSMRCTDAARAVAVATMPQHASSQRVAQAAEPYNATADVCRRDMSVVIRARLTAALPRRGTHASAHRSPCHPVTARKVPNRAAPTTRAAPKKAAALPRGCSARRRFRRETCVPEGQSEAVFEAKFRASPPASHPPSFGLVPIGRPKVTPHLARGRSANDRTRNGARRNQPRKHVCQLPT
jgi:hypothetical protein